MGVERIVFRVDGMTCSSCESRISRLLQELAGVKHVNVSLRGATVEIEYDDTVIGRQELKTAITAAGYQVVDKKAFGRIWPLGIGLLLVGVYLAAASSGVFASIPKIDSSIGYAALFAVGALTSVHCIAMCGGIALSQSATSEGGKQALIPALLYNSGRIVSYTIIGAIVGAAGAAFSFSPMVKGIIAALAGAFMVLLGLRMLGLFGSLPRLAFLVPSALRRGAGKIAKRIWSGGPMGVGMLNGFMPCGPLQTMQLYALGTGSAAAGALSMFLFSLGTVPLMLIFGVSASLLPRKFAPVMVRASAVLVLFLGAVTFVRAAGLAGLPVPLGEQPGNRPGVLKISGSEESGQKKNLKNMPTAIVVDGKQSIITEFKDGNYIPFAVQAGVPLTWTIRIAEEDINGCNNRVVVPGYAIEKPLIPGDNIIEFTPKTEGIIPYSCWMGMIRSRITVVGGDNVPAQEL